MSSLDDAIDPVCGMTIAKARAPLTRVYGDARFYLCSVECAAKFDADADAYAAVLRLDLPGWGKTPHPDSVARQFRSDAAGRDKS